jgi:hypothetical protein
MRLTWSSNVLAAAAVLLGLGIPASVGEIPWAESYDDARKTAADKNALVMADFYTEW